MIINDSVVDKAIFEGNSDKNVIRGSIKSSAKAFKVLTTGLYSNLIRAIIREISCNAYDAHVEAGCADRPFDVHLPSELEPWFSVRDYGVGLSHEQAENIYMTFFDSTKSGSNDAIGGLGLGSKSPFNYTNNFAVTAIKDGIINVYTAFIDDDGLGLIPLHSGPTTEPNGVEVKVAVNTDANNVDPDSDDSEDHIIQIFNQSLNSVLMNGIPMNDRSAVIQHKKDVRKLLNRDIQTFVQEAGFVYSTFDVRPNFIGGTVPKFHDFEYVMKDIAPGVHKVANNAIVRGGAVAIMGQIPYPLHNAPRLLASKSDAYVRLCDKPLIVNFGIGELSIQPSREGLSYDAKTIDAIADKFNQISNDLEARAIADLAPLEANPILHGQKLLQLEKDSMFKQVITTAINKGTIKNKYLGLNDLSSYYGLSNVNSGIDIAKAKSLNIAINQHSVVTNDGENAEFKYKLSQYGEPNELFYPANAKNRNEYSRGVKCEFTDILTSYTSYGFDPKKFAGINDYSAVPSMIFVIRDIGLVQANRRIVHACNQIANFTYRHMKVMYITPVDKAKPMDIAAFAKKVNIPEEMIMKASDFPEAPPIVRVPKEERVVSEDVYVETIERDGNRDRLLYRNRMTIDTYLTDNQHYVKAGCHMLYLTRKPVYAELDINPKDTYAVMEKIFPKWVASDGKRILVCVVGDKDEKVAEERGLKNGVTFLNDHMKQLPPVHLGAMLPSLTPEYNKVRNWHTKINYRDLSSVSDSICAIRDKTELDNADSDFVKLAEMLKSMQNVKFNSAVENMVSGYVNHRGNKDLKKHIMGLIEKDAVEEAKTFKQLLDDAEKKYPMIFNLIDISTVRYHAMDDIYAMAKDYINMVDNYVTK